MGSFGFGPSLRARRRGAAGGGFAVIGTLDAAQFKVAYSDSLTVSGGTAPYSVSGLPAYGPVANVSGGTITFSGTPF